MKRSLLNSTASGSGEPTLCEYGVPGLLDLPHSAFRVNCGDIDMRIDHEAMWHYEGTPMRRKELMCLFASTLQRDTQGGYWLVTPAEIARIQVDDVPFAAVELFVGGSGADQILSFRTNIDELVTCGPDHPLRVETDPDSGEPSPYIMLDKGLEARLTRSVFYDVVSRGFEEEQNGEKVFGVWSRNSFFRLGTLEDVQ